MGDKLLMDMSNRELMERYRRANNTTVHGTASYEAERDRRSRNMQSWVTIFLTVASTITSIAALVISIKVR